MFLATEELGVPGGVDVVAMARQFDEEQEEARMRRAVVTQDQSDRIMRLLTEPADAVEEWPHPDRTSPYLTDIREQWEEKAQLLRDAIAAGGELWHWSTASRHTEAVGEEVGLAVVKEGRVMAFMLTMRSF